MQKSIALILGSGAARGLVHIGVIDWLEANDVTVSAICGSSMGALVGGIYAAGALDDFRHWICALDELDVVRLLDLSWTARGLMRGEKVVGFLGELLGDRRIEDLPLAYTAVAVDVERQEEVWLSRGPIFDAIRASIAIPTLLTPHEYRGRTLFDGGLLNPLPIAPAFAHEADLRVAVDLNGPPDSRWTDRQPPKASSGSEDGYRRKVKQFLAGLGSRPREGAEDWNVFEIALASFDTMQGCITRMKLAAYPPDLSITVPRNRCGAHQFFRAAELIDYGRELADECLSALRVRDA